MMKVNLAMKVNYTFHDGMAVCRDESGSTNEKSYLVILANTGNQKVARKKSFRTRRAYAITSDNQSHSK
ncbi:hypothetical protein [Vibrio sp. HN007]|uniref:hypothetical protein n=1 Tax=Vibrio iocasae TaxID=3098914 RepID=UPI0035D52A53